MAADIEAISLIIIGPTDPADHLRIGLEHDAWRVMLGQLISRGEPRRSSARDHGLVRGVVIFLVLVPESLSKRA